MTEPPAAGEPQPGESRPAAAPPGGLPPAGPGSAPAAGPPPGYAAGASGAGAYGPGGYGPGAYAPGAYGPSPYGPAAYGPGGYGPIPPAVSLPDGSPALPRPVTGSPDFAEAFRFSWKSFGRYPWPMMVPGLLTLLAGLAGGVLAVIGFFWMFGAALSDSTASGAAAPVYFAGLIPMILGIALFVVAAIYLQGALISGVLKVADGRPVTARDFTAPARPGAFILTSILIGLATVVGMVLLIVPGLIAAFAFQYAPVIVLEQKVSATAAMRASAKLAFGNLGDSVVVWILHYAYSYVGSFVFLVGGLVTQPMGAAFLVHCYRDLTRRPVPSYL